jgi:DNA-binding Lrp family transcriptional regulator
MRLTEVPDTMVLPNDVQQLDTVDRVLLAALQRDGRTPNNELARQAGIAPSTCLARVRSLRERGAIRGIHADVDPEVLGLSIQAMIAVSLASDARSSLTDFAAAVAEKPYVLNVFFVSGSYDYLLHVAADGSDGLRDIVTDLSGTGMVSDTETHLIFEHRAGRADATHAS